MSSLRLSVTAEIAYGILLFLLVSVSHFLSHSACIQLQRKSLPDGASQILQGLHLNPDSETTLASAHDAIGDVIPWS